MCSHASTSRVALCRDGIPRANRRNASTPNCDLTEKAERRYQVRFGVETGRNPPFHRLHAAEHIPIIDGLLNFPDETRLVPTTFGGDAEGKGDSAGSGDGAARPPRDDDGAENHDGAARLPLDGHSDHLPRNAHTPHRLLAGIANRQDLVTEWDPLDPVLA
ncbi:hypothetical protein PR202_gb03529 [Eleusine coracana subsp. coracana]|uniref:Uncharacterized protein n=1 Tax=Eleusine coracana subsp. coracana TaxID=191504 RepID=A0AAV5E227_ELECO|nr:hypothetical protein PR202_gb03529 [Eleusine coracana subsp. coracana]